MAMPDGLSKDSSGNVPKQIVEEFAKRLADANVPSDVIERLRTLLLSSKALSDKALKEAILTEEPLP